jgi:hypothetical protein
MYIYYTLLYLFKYYNSAFKLALSLLFAFISLLASDSSPLYLISKSLINLRMSLLLLIFYF